MKIERALENKEPFDSIIPDKTSLVCGFMMGCLPIGEYNFEISSMLYEVDVFENYPKIRVRKI